MHNQAKIRFPTKEDSGNPDYNHGCWICGFSAPSLKNNGLERAHIFGEGAVTNLPWNLIPLCPRCHQSFDSILKPVLANALEYASEGFMPNPIDKTQASKRFPLKTLIAHLRVQQGAAD